MKNSSTQTRNLGDRFYTQLRSVSSGSKALEELLEMYSPPPSMLESGLLLSRDQEESSESINNLDLSKMVKIVKI